MNKIGIQLYSFVTESDLSFEDKIRISAELGFTHVEFAGGYDNISAKELKAMLDKHGVKAHSAHIGIDKIEEQIPYMAEVGVKYLIVPMAAFCTKEETLEFANELNELGKKAAAHGVKVGYHNHAQEFYMVEGKSIMDWLIEFTDPENVVIELDCGWVSVAGETPEEYIKKHAGRISLIHIKENSEVLGAEKPMSKYETPKPHPKDADGNPIFTEEQKKAMEDHRRINVKQGTGIVNWKAVVEAANAQCDDVVYVIERESSYNEPKDRVACLKEDIAWVKENL